MTELHPEAQELAARVADAGLRPLAELTPAEARAQVAGLRDALGTDDAREPPADHAAAGRDGPVPVLVYEPDRPARGVIVFAHGGGWVLCKPDDADTLCRRIVASTSCVLVNVGYRLAPEHPFPAAVDDVEDAFTWAAARWPALPLVVAGESAGGNLAAAVALRAAAQGAHRIAGQALIYPVTDCSLDTASYTAHASSAFLTRADMEWFWNHYAPTAEQREHPCASPLREADLAGVAPAVLVLAGQDPLHDEGAAYGEALRAAGVPVTIQDQADLPHGFLSMLGALGAAEAPYEAFAAALGRLIEP